MVQMCTSNDTMNAVATQGFRLATENGGDASWDAAWELLNSVTGFWPLTLRWKEMLKLKKKRSVLTMRCHLNYFLIYISKFNN
jgi:hypothetical protein